MYVFELGLSYLLIFLFFRFFINNATGELSVANDLNSYVGQVINLNYTAVDGGGLSTSVIVAISIAVPVKLGIVFSQVSYLTSLPEDSTVFTPNTTISVRKFSTLALLKHI